MRVALFACASLVCAFALDLGAEDNVPALDPTAAASTEPSHFDLLTPLTKAEEDQIRGENGGPASYSAQLASAFTAARQYLAAVRAGGCVGTITRNANLTWTYNPCGL